MSWVYQSLMWTCEAAVSQSWPPVTELLSAFLGKNSSSLLAISLLLQIIFKRPVISLRQCYKSCGYSYLNWHLPCHLGYILHGKLYPETFQVLKFFFFLTFCYVVLCFIVYIQLLFFLSPWWLSKLTLLSYVDFQNFRYWILG